MEKEREGEKEKERKRAHSRRQPENRLHPARLSARQESVHAHQPAGPQVLVLRPEPGYVLVRVVGHLVQVRVVREGRRVGREEGPERVREEGGDFLLVQDGLSVGCLGVRGSMLDVR